MSSGSSSLQSWPENAGREGPSLPAFATSRPSSCFTVVLVPRARCCDADTVGLAALNGKVNDVVAAATVGPFVFVGASIFVSYRILSDFTLSIFAVSI